MVIDPERDIQVPDDEPRVVIATSPILSRGNLSPVYVDIPAPIVEVSVMPKPSEESDLETELDLDSEVLVSPASSTASGRRLALTLR